MLAGKGWGTMEARLIQNGVFGYCYLYDADVATGNEDIKHAFDSPSQTGGFQLGMMRLGMPTNLIKLDQIKGII